MTSDNRTIGETNIDEIIDVSMSGRANVILDNTILSTLMACARLADFRFNMNLFSIHGKSNSLEAGSIVHKFLETLYLLQSRGVPREKAVQFAFTAAELYIKGCPGCKDFQSTEEQPKPICGHAPNEYPGVQNTPKDSTDKPKRIGWQYVLDTCDQYQKHYINDHWVTLEVETVKRKVIYEDSEIRVLWLAKLDWYVDTNQGIAPVDHKTMSQRRDTNSMNSQFMGQCMVTGTRQMIINKIGFQSSLKPEEKFQRTPISYSPERLIEWSSETVPYYAKLLLMYAETGHWPPNFNACEGKYGNCTFYEDICSANPSVREENLKLNFYVGPVWNPGNEENE